MTLSAVLLQRCRGLSEGDAASAEAYATFFGLWCVCHILKRRRGHQLSTTVFASSCRPQAERITEFSQPTIFKSADFTMGTGAAVGVV